MKLLFVTNDLRAFRDHRSNIAFRAVEEGHEVHLCYGAGKDAESHFAPHGITLHPVEMDLHRFRLLQDLKLVRTFAALVKQLQPDLVHTVTIKPNLYAGLGLCLVPRTRRPALVSTFPGLGKIFEPRPGFAHKFREMLVVRALRLVAARTACQATFENTSDPKRFEGLGIFKPENTHALMGAGIDLSRFYPRDQNANASASRLRVVFASRPLSTKGVVVFIEGAIAANAAGIQAEFVIAGDVDKDDVDRVDVKAELEQRGLGEVDWIRFVGKVEIDDMPELLRNADIVCLPSQLLEGFPRVLIEAAATGAALLASDQPSVRQILKDRENGWLVDPFDQDKFNAVMIEACRDRETIARFGMNSQNLIENLPLGEREVAQRFIEIYAIAKQKAPGNG